MKRGDKGFLNSLSASEISELESLLGVIGATDPECMQWVSVVLDEIRVHGKSKSYAALLAQDFVRKPVDIMQYIDDPEYMGSFGAQLYPPWREELQKVFDPSNNIREWCISGAVGIGKNTVGTLALSYVLYKLSCLVDPCQYFHLMKDSQIVVGVYSVTRDKAFRVGYGHLREYVSSSPYFKLHFPKNAKYAHSLSFPNNISVVSGSQDLHALGENLFSLMLDELNFMRDSSRGAEGGSPGQAYRLYTSCRRRVISRFGVDVPGLVILISSRRSHADFLEGHIRQHRDDSNVHVSEFSLWDVKPASYGTERFRVFLGDHTRGPRILSEEEDVSGIPVTLVETVPIEHRRDFEANLGEAIRDLAGRPTEAVNPLIRDSEMVLAACDRRRQHPFSKSELAVSHLDQYKIGDYFRQQDMLAISHGGYVPKINKNALRFLHIDLSKNCDSAGVGMGHVSHALKSRQQLLSGIPYQEWIPHIYIDFMLRLNPPAVGEIDFQAITDFVLQLRSFGYKIGMVSYDGWQSVGSLQLLESQGLKVRTLSVDRTDTPYIHLRQAFTDARIHLYYYPIFVSEILNLEHDIKSRKVDHKSKMIDQRGNVIPGSKDVSDCVAAITQMCMDSISTREGLFDFMSRDTHQDMRGDPDSLVHRVRNIEQSNVDSLVKAFYGRS